jgi:acetyl-CoA synthetase
MPGQTDIIAKLGDLKAESPNLENYDQTYKDFSWQKAAGQMLDYFPDGSINIAYNCVDRHALGDKKDKVALLYVDNKGSEESYSFGDLKTQTDKFANLLTGIGAGQGDRIFIFLPPIPERYVAFLGTLKIGAIAGTMFAAFQEMALKDRLLDSEAKIVVTDTDLYPRIENILSDLPNLEKVIVIERGKELPIGDQVVSYEKTMATISDEFEVAKMKPEDYSYMLYTSGTTGKPKGVVHSHNDVLQAMVTTKFSLDVKPDDIYWCTADLGWVTGVVYGVLGIWGLGCTSLIFNGRYSPESWYGLVEKYKVSVWYSAPTAIRLLMGADKQPTDYDLSSLRHLCSVGEPLNPEAIWWGMKVFGLPFHDTWWQTELGGISISNYPCLGIKPGSMGKPLPGIEAAILDENNNVVTDGSEGDLVLKSSTVSSLMKTIWKNEAKFDSYFKGGWYVSGDRALKDADGYFWFVGRSDDVINTAGERVGPFEVESALVTYPDVIEAGVIGKPDEVRGQIIKAFVVVKPGVGQTDELKELIKAHVKKHLAGHAYPREIEFIDKLPKTRSGKIMRRILKAQEMGEDVGDTSTLEEY